MMILSMFMLIQPLGTPDSSILVEDAPIKVQYILHQNSVAIGNTTKVYWLSEDFDLDGQKDLIFLTSQIWSKFCPSQSNVWISLTTRSHDKMIALGQADDIKIFYDRDANYSPALIISTNDGIMRTVSFILNRPAR